VKTFFTGDRFGEIVEASHVPVLALGSKKLPRERDALELAAHAIRTGARGVVFGRNLVQARDPEGFLEALRAVVKDGADVAEVADRLGIE
jgi:DhnA family fructose-bisphosphate aldolase class Ia